MASASSGKTLPADFQVPFRVVSQETRHDCQLAAVATITGKSLAEVWTAAYSFGLPKIGTYYITEDLLSKLFLNLGGLVSSVWKPFTSFDALPDVALLWVDARADDPENTGRAVVFHHVRAVPDKWSSFSYVLDMGQADTTQQVVADYRRFAPVYYMSVAPKGEQQAKKK
jgi:hypothetical protein